MIVKSILDTDLYKFTTSYAYMKLFPHAIGTFEFFDRDTEEFVQQLRMEIVYFCSLHLTQEEQDYMTTHCRFIPPMYWEWLSGIKLSPGKVSIWLDEDKHLHITAKDYLYRVTLYEVPILAIVSEPKIVLSNQNQMYFSEFGTRRRYSYNVQEAIVKSLKDSATYCTGTSNCYLAGINRGLVTDNLTEHNLGFWTIHGDVGDFDPIQGLWKTEVDADVVGKITERHFKSRFKRLLSPIIVPREMYD